MQVCALLCTSIARQGEAHRNHQFQLVGWGVRLIWKSGVGLLWGAEKEVARVSLFAATPVQKLTLTSQFVASVFSGSCSTVPKLGFRVSFESKLTQKRLQRDFCDFTDAPQKKKDVVDKRLGADGITSCSLCVECAGERFQNCQRERERGGPNKTVRQAASISRVSLVLAVCKCGERDKTGPWRGTCMSVGVASLLSLSLRAGRDPVLFAQTHTKKTDPPPPPHSLHAYPVQRQCGTVRKTWGSAGVEVQVVFPRCPTG